MEKKYKIALIIVGALLVTGAIGLVIYQLTKDKEDQTDENPFVENENESLENTDSGNNDHSDKEENELGGVGTSWDNEITPIYNTEKELDNPLNEIMGHLLYPKSKISGGWGYANIRSSAEVNTNQGWWDGIDNLITTINKGTPIGTVLSETTGVYNGYSYRWLKIKLTKPTGGWFIDYTEGYVRADTVTFNPYQL